MIDMTTVSDEDLSAGLRLIRDEAIKEAGV